MHNFSGGHQSVAAKQAPHQEGHFYIVKGSSGPSVENERKPVVGACGARKLGGRLLSGAWGIRRGGVGERSKAGEGLSDPRQTDKDQLLIA